MVTTRRQASGICAGLLIAAALLAPPARAITIPFEDYATGELVGKPATGTKWAGQLACFAVAAGIGVGGGQGIEMVPTATLYAMPYFTPSNADLGGAIDTNRLYRYSFDAQMPSAVMTATFIQVWVGRKTTTPSGAIARINFQGNGTVQPQGSSAITGVMSDHAWHRFTGMIDFAKHTYSFSVDGVQKFASQPFYSGGQSIFGYFGLNVQTSDAANNHIRLDNILVEVYRPTSTIITLR